MFDSPKSTTYVAPAEPLDLGTRYLVRLLEIVDTGPSQFQPEGRDPNNPVRRMLWKFRMANADGTPVMDLDGNPYEYSDYTNSTTSKGNNTATARLWMEALVGRDIEDSELNADFYVSLIDKVASILLEQKPSGRISILKMTPYKPVRKTSAEVAAASRNAQETVTRARTATPAAVADDEPPF